MNGVDTGNNSDFYDCKDDMHELVVDQRQAHCAQGTNDNADEDCRAVIAALCKTGISVQTMVATGVAGVSYPCATSEVQAVKTARETHCRMGASNSGGLCNDTIASLCLADPFEKADEGAFGSLCVDSEGTTYAATRDSTCRTAPAGDGNEGGKCEITKKTFCDGEHVGDAPYADVCGPDDTNLAGQTAFCRLSTHSTTVPDCGATIVTVCDVEKGDPFDALCPTGDNTDRQTRATACFGEDAPKSGTDCKDVDKCNGDPFGTNLAGQDCDDTIYVTARTQVCETPATSFTTGCVNGTHGEVTKAQRGYCAGGAALNESCPTLLANICTGENSLINGVATGYPSVNYDCKDDTTTQAVINERQAHCADPVGVTTGCPDVLTMLCTGANSLLDMAPTGVTGKTFDCAAGDTYKDAKEIHCDATPTATGCPVFLTELCDGANSVQMQVGAGEYDCAGDVNQLDARKAFCREDDDSDGLCTTTIVGLCSDNEFEQRADDSYVCGDELIGGTNYQETREMTCKSALTEDRCKPTIERICGKATAPAIDASNVRNGLCAGSAYNTARAVACSLIPNDDDQRATLCGSETMLGTDWHAYCNTGDGANNAEVCPMTYNDGTRRACIDTNPFDGSCDEEFHDNRVRACVAGDKMADPSNCANTV
ncbi:MAG: hypothetical protein K8953_06550, partial [Proteobacteria bacterium]|nr:hypothetical protein [Pseudomonadota bacterium]